MHFFRLVLFFFLAPHTLHPNMCTQVKFKLNISQMYTQISDVIPTQNSRCHSWVSEFLVYLSAVYDNVLNDLQNHKHGYFKLAFMVKNHFIVFIVCVCVWVLFLCGSLNVYVYFNNYIKREYYRAFFCVKGLKGYYVPLPHEKCLLSCVVTQEIIVAV